MEGFSGTERCGGGVVDVCEIAADFHNTCYYNASGTEEY
jgi:hypothetical protein